MEVKNTKGIVPDQFHALIYGESGAGKTTLASTLDSVVVISVESGLLSLKGHDVPYVECTTLAQVREAIIWAAKSEYKNIFIDSLSEIASLVVDEAKKKFPDSKNTMQLWGLYNENITKMIKFTRDLKKNVIYTALEKVEKNETGKRYHLPDLPGSIASRAPQFFDFVFNLKVIQREDEKHRVLITDKQDRYVCKSRLVLQEFEEPYLGKIIETAFKTGES